MCCVKKRAPLPVRTESKPPPLQIVTVFFYYYLCPTKGLLGFFLNGLTIVSFLKVRELRTPSNFLVFSLAMADIGISMNATIAAFSSFLR